MFVKMQTQCMTIAKFMLVVGMLSNNVHSESVDKMYEKLINFSFPETLQQNENFTKKYLCYYTSPNKCCSCEKDCRFYELAALTLLQIETQNLLISI